MNRRSFIQQIGMAGTSIYLSPAMMKNTNSAVVSVGMIGLDTSHCTAFTKSINSLDEQGQSTGFKVTHAYPHGSRDIESSVSRIPKYTKEMQGLGVQIVDSIEALLEQVEVVLLETNDGRLHLAQARKVIEAKKPLFIDKPVAASLADAIAIFEFAERHKVPVFSSSSLRYSNSMKAILDGKIGKVLEADTYSPAKIEKTHPDLFWYGIHGVETLYALMGVGCQSVQRIHTKDTDLVIGEWQDGRIGSFRGLRAGKTGYGGNAFGTEGIATVGYEGYDFLVREIIQFFKTGIPPVSADETIEIFAFMEAAEVSKKLGGAKVSLEFVMEAVEKR